MGVVMWVDHERVSSRPLVTTRSQVVERLVMGAGGRDGSSRRA